MMSVEIYLPMNDNQGTPFPEPVFTQIEPALTEKFGGVTAYKRAPAQGRWKSEGSTDADDIPIFDVIVGALDKEWWNEFRRTLEERLEQEQILITARDLKSCRA
jgi:hypothetical protein